MKIELQFEINEKTKYCDGCKAVVNRSDYSGNYDYYCRVFDDDLDYENDSSRMFHNLYKCSDCLEFIDKHKQ